MAISYSSGLYTLSTSGSYTPTDLYSYDSAGITRHTGSRTIYDFGSSRILVQSGVTLTIDTSATYGEILFSDPGWDGSTYLHHIKVESGGTLVVGSSTTKDLVIYCKDLPTNSYLHQNRHFYIAGTFNWLGGIIAGNGPSIESYNGSDGEVSGTAELVSDGSEAANFRLSDVDWEVVACGMNYAACISFVEFTTPISGLKFFNFPTSQPTVGLDNDGVNGVWLLCKDWDVSDSTVAKGFGYWDQRWCRYINQVTGTDFGEPQGNLADNSNNRGLLEVRQEIEFSCNSGGGAKFYTVDTDNSNRLADNLIADNPDYEADRTYELTESSGVASYTTDGGVLIGVYWRTTGGLAASNNNFDSRGINNDKTDIFTWLKVEYGYQPATQNIVMKGAGGVEAEIVALVDLGITESTKATVAAYTGISPNYSGGTLTVTVTENHTLNEVYDYIKYYESENPDDVWSNSKTSFITTANKLSYSYSNLVIVVDGCNLTCGAGQILPTKPTVSSGGFFEDAEGAIWDDGGATYYASSIAYTAKDLGTPVAEVEIAHFDSSGNNRTYNTSLTQVESLTTGATAGDITGYAVWKIDSTEYSSHTLKARQYGYKTYEIPKNLDGTPIEEDINLVEDTFIGDTEGNVAAYTGIVIDYSPTTKEITVTEDHTIQEVMDYVRYSDALQTNLDEDDTMSTADGSAYTLDTDWNLIIDGVGVFVNDETKIITFSGSGELTVSNGGAFEDENGAIWEDGGSVYYGSHITYTVKDAGTPVQYTEVVHLDSSNNNRTYNDSFVAVDSLTSDASGVVEGYAVWKIDTTSYTSHTLRARQYGYNFYSTPKTLNGMAITEDINLAENAKGLGVVKGKQYKQHKRYGYNICAQCAKTLNKRRPVKQQNRVKKTDIVEVACKNCNKVRTVQYRMRDNLCPSCAMKIARQIHKDSYNTKQLPDDFQQRVSKGILSKSSPDERSNRSQQAAKKGWKQKEEILRKRDTKEYRKKLKQIWDRPGFRENISNLASEKALELWKDPKYREKLAIVRSKQPKISSQQKLLSEILRDLGVEFEEESRIGYFCFDCRINPQENIYITKPLLIEVQGEYWHSLEKSRRNDKAKATYIKKYFDYDLKYIWEHEFYTQGRVLTRLKYWLGIDKPTIDIDFKRICQKRPDIAEADLFISKYHYTGKLRSNVCILAFYYEDIMIGLITFSPVSRIEIAKRLKVKRDYILELSRLCIHPDYQVKNLASFLLGKAIRYIKTNMLNITTLVSFSDESYNHTGIVYKATNWIFDGVVSSDYWYVDKDGYVMHKKTLYNRAIKNSLTEKQYAQKHSFKKVHGKPKRRYLYQI